MLFYTTIALSGTKILLNYNDNIFFFLPIFNEITIFFKYDIFVFINKNV